MLALVKLQTFVRVAESGSFTKAALLLDTVHSGLSRQVIELERELGYRLLTRTGRGVRLTDQGKWLYERAKHLIAAVQAVSDEAQALRGVPVGTVTIGMPGSVAVLLGSRLLIEASRKYPQVRIRLIEGLSGSIEEMLAVGRLDFALYYSRPARRSIHGRQLLESDLYLIGGVKDPLMRQQEVETARLKGVRLILPGRPHAIRVAVEEACAAAQVDCDVAYEADSMSTMKRAVEVGAGYTIATWDSVAREVEAGTLAAVKLVKPVSTQTLMLQWSPRQPLTLAARTIFEEVNSLALAILADRSLRLRAVPSG